jgi:hypothetical protein
MNLAQSVGARREFLTLAQICRQSLSD